MHRWQVVKKKKSTRMLINGEMDGWIEKMRRAGAKPFDVDGQEEVFVRHAIQRRFDVIRSVHLIPPGQQLLVIA